MLKPLSVAKMESTKNQILCRKILDVGFSIRWAVEGSWPPKIVSRGETQPTHECAIQCCESLLLRYVWVTFFMKRLRYPHCLYANLSKLRIFLSIGKHQNDVTVSTAEVYSPNGSDFLIALRFTFLSLRLTFSSWGTIRFRCPFGLSSSSFGDSFISSGYSDYIIEI